MIGGLAVWFDERLRAARFARQQLKKVFPDHWSFLLGEVALYSFVILVLTGVYMTFFFVPSTEETVYQGAYAPLRGTRVSVAYATALELSFSVRAGLVMRQMHHWAALLFMAAIGIHMGRVFFTGAFRKPREINWVIGVTLALLGIANGFAGYSLLDDLLSGTGLRIAYSVVLSIPVLGTWMAFLVFGGEFPTPEMITRLYNLHILLLPAAIAVLITVHLAIIWHQKHTQFPGEGRRETNVVGERLWPTYAAKSVALFFLVAAVLAALGGLVQINPIWLYGPFEPSAVPIPAQPDWYVGWLEGLLRLFPAWELQAFGFLVPNPFFPGVLLPGITVAVLYLWPFLEQRLTGDDRHHHLLDRPHQAPVRSAVGTGVIAFYVIAFVAGANDILAVRTGIPVLTITRVLRVTILVLPPVIGYLTYRVCRPERGGRPVGVG